ncbi:uncharacterized protein LOC144099715 isoform X1 [Amblyomma americanum]
MATDAAGTGQRPALQNRGSTTHLPPWRFHFEGLSDNNRGGVDSPSGASHARCAPRISTLRSGACPAANIDSGGTRHHDDAGFAATRKASVRSTVIVELDFFLQSLQNLLCPCDHDRQRETSRSWLSNEVRRAIYNQMSTCRHWWYRPRQGAALMISPSSVDRKGTR